MENQPLEIKNKELLKAFLNFPIIDLKGITQAQQIVETSAKQEAPKQAIVAPKPATAKGQPAAPKPLPQPVATKVERAPLPPIEKTVTTLNIEKEGNLSSGLLVLFTSKENSLPYGEKEFLRKVLLAVNIQIENVTLINTMQAEMPDYLRLIDALRPKFVFAFGIGQQYAIEPKPVNHYQRLVGKAQLVTGHSLKEIEASVAYKKALWGVMKELFVSK